MRRAVTAFCCLLLFGGCGYHVQGRGENLPADVRSVFIEIFANRTLEPFVETTVSAAVSEGLIRGRLLQVVDQPAAADAILSGEVTTYSSTPIAFDQQDDISRYRSQMTVSAWLRRTTTNEVIWKGSVSWSEEYPASRDRALQEDNEATAIRVSSERIAEEFYYRLGEGF